MRSYKNIALIFFLMALTLVVSSACGKKKSTPIVQDPAPTNPPPSDPDFNPSNANIRLCPTQIIQQLSIPALEAYMFTSIDEGAQELEDGASWCMKLYASSGKYFDAAFRVEYEANEGVRSYNLLSDYLVYSEIKDGKIHLLWFDEAGFIEIKGTKQPNSSWRAKVRFANLPSLNEVQNQKLTFSDVYKKCKNGTYSFSQCWSNQVIVSPTWPSNNGQLTTSQLLTYAEEYLSGKHGADAHTLGFINFKLNNVVVK